MPRAAAAKFVANNYSTPMPTIPGNAGVVMIRDFKFTCLTTTPGTVIATGAATTMDTTGFFTGDKLYLCQLAPNNSPGWQLVGIEIDIPALDTGSTIRLTLGDSTSATRFVSATLMGLLGCVNKPGRISSFVATTIYEAEAGAEGMVAGCVRGSLPVSYNPAAYATPTDHDDLILTAATGAGTGVLGASVIIKGQIYYTNCGLAAL